VRLAAYVHSAGLLPVRCKGSWLDPDVKVGEGAAIESESEVKRNSR